MEVERKIERPELVSFIAKANMESFCFIGVILSLHGIDRHPLLLYDDELAYLDRTHILRLTVQFFLL